MPPKVTLATRLMWFLWFSSVAFMIFNLSVAARLPQPPIVSLTIMSLVAAVLLALLIRAVARGRNWARITYSVLVVFGILIIVMGWVRGVTLTRSLISAALVVTYSGILWLLFHSGSASWFQKTRGNAT